MPPKRKRIVLNVDQKLEIISRIETGATQASIAELYGVGTSTVSDIYKQRDALQKFVLKTTPYEVSARRKVMRSATHDAVDQATYRWFLQQRGSNIPITGDSLRAQALKFNEACLCDGHGGNPEFRASAGWLQKFKDRHGICGLFMRRESLSTTLRVVDFFLNQLEDVITDEELSREQIYNCGETGLFWKALPHCSLVGPEEKTATGHERSKERLTLLATANATGTHKLPLLLIGKSKNLRCFKNINTAALPVTYQSQKSSWMNGEIFSEWFHKNFVPAVRNHQTQNGLPEKAILLLDNTPCHPKAADMMSDDGNIRCIFLPPNTTPLLQPMDQGILETTKRIYRKNLIWKIISSDSDSQHSTEGKVDFIKSFTLKDAVYMLAAAWDAVETSIITKCWQKLNLGPEAAVDLEREDGATLQNDDEEVAALVHQLPGGSGCPAEEIQEWLECDKDDLGWETLTDQEILDSVIGQRNDDTEDDDDEAKSGMMETPDVPTHGEATEMAAKLMCWLERQPEADPNHLMLLKNICDLAAAKDRFCQLGK
ncbi:jerky protein homolog-like [Diadema antillarum]|uniref:jerky protein homolog-like n=1 Tax=Diadema antillarum TaxID=105358 RepID=UPI003A8420EF